MIAKEVERKLFGYIDDVNLNEISSQIANDNLKNWISAWSTSFKKSISNLLVSDECTYGWIPLCEAKPIMEEPVQILAIDNSFDRPDTYVTCGYWVNYSDNEDCDVWISYDDAQAIHGIIVAWKPFGEILEIKDLKKLGWI